MQRKTVTKTVTKTAKDQLMGKLPFQKNHPSGKPECNWGLVSQPLSAAAVMTAFPLYGGTSPVTEDKTVTPDAATAESSTSTPDTPAVPDDSEEMTPEKVTALLKQVSDLTGKIATLTKENEGFKTKETQAQRQQQTREQQLEADLQERDKVIAKMDAVIRHTAVINAIQGTKDVEWHSARHVMNELDPNSFELDVDLENGTATVTGIESELKRVAKECHWLVSKDKTQTPSGGSQRPAARGSGTPPPAPNGANTKQTARAELINRFPVIAHGRVG